MTKLEALALKAMHAFDPERAHGLAISALKLGLVPLSGPVTSPRLATTLAGLICRIPSASPRALTKMPRCSPRSHAQGSALSKSAP